MAKFEHDILEKIQTKKYIDRIHDLEGQLQQVAGHLRSIRQMRVERDYFHKQYEQAMAHVE